MTLTAKAQLVGAASRIIGHRLGELVTPTAFRGAATVPSSTDELTTTWLTRALCAGCAGAEVVDFEIGAGSDGTSSRRPLLVRYNEAGRAAGLPTALYTKSTPDLMTRLFCGLNNLAVGETEFYLRIRPELKIETPHGYCGVYDQRTCRSMLLLEDIAATRGATFGDPTVTEVDQPNAERMVELMATYHGALWEDPRLDTQFTWLARSEDFQRRINDMMGFKRMFHNGLNRAADFMPPALTARRGDLWAALMASLELRAHAPQTFLHQDVHARNWYFTGDSRIGLYDWQACAKGLWAVDVAYAVSCGLTVESRQAWESDLLAHYLERLGTEGGDPPSYDTAWTSYRQQMMHGLAYWLATIGVSKLQPELQPRAVAVAHIERMSRAVDDLDTLYALLD
ncbi:phosphotransferase [Mycobacterium sp.]|uniref:phosphotransferase n=1 Tax=Mycobacterium sp. TaxID=1785 RepID=UPI003C72911C